MLVPLGTAPTDDGGDTLPTPEPSPATASSPIDEARLERVLVVDDEGPVLRLAAAALRTAGYRVETAASGEDALRRLADGGFDAQVVVLDITMPGMSGLEVLGALRVDRPSLPVLLSSGYASPDHATGIDEFTGFLPKPYRLEELRTAVERVHQQAGLASEARR